MRSLIILAMRKSPLPLPDVPTSSQRQQQTQYKGAGQPHEIEDFIDLSRPNRIDLAGTHLGCAIVFVVRTILAND